MAPPRVRIICITCGGKLCHKLDTIRDLNRPGFRGGRIIGFLPTSAVFADSYKFVARRLEGGGGYGEAHGGVVQGSQLPDNGRMKLRPMGVTPGPLRPDIKG